MEISFQYSEREEFFNALSHGVGVLLSAVGLVILTANAARLNNIVSIISVAIYGISMVAMYLMSTLYHAVSHGKAKRLLQVFDHASIYLVIAGGYTPLTLILLGGGQRASILLLIIWSLAIIGIALNIVNLKRFKKTGMAIYLLMGWSALAEIRNIVTLLGAAGTALFLAGGMAYMIGLIFYKKKSVKYMHSIWHLFVLAGGILHYLCILKYVIIV